jgi:hypothetical protein
MESVAAQRSVAAGKVFDLSQVPVRTLKTGSTTVWPEAA